jgi:hypothetical protein
MMRRSAMAVLVAQLALAAAFPAHAQTKLEWKLKEGDKFYLENVSTLNQTMKTAGVDTIQNNIEQTTVSLLTVKKKNADGLVLEQKIETMRLKPLSPTNLDEKTLKQAQALEGAVFTFTISPKGEVTRFSGYEDFIKKIGGNDQAVGKEVRKFLTEDLLKAMPQELFGFLPDKAVKKGDKWERKVSYPLGPLGTLTSTNKYSYDGTEKVEGKDLDKITVEMAMTYTTPPATPEGAKGLEVRKGELKAEGAKATIYFDSAAGRLVRSEETVPLKGKLTFAYSGTETEVDLDQKQTIKNRVLEKNPLAK